MSRIVNTSALAIGLLVAAAFSFGHAAERFTAVMIDPPFDAVLGKNQLLMEVGGAKIVVNPDGSRMVIGVGQVAYDKQAPPQQRLNKERVARQKALRELVAQTSPIQVVHRERLEEKTRVETLAGGVQRGEAIEEYLSVTTSEFEAVVKDLPVVGRWYSADGSILYIAIGKELSADQVRP
jgi:hypothetical protein